ISILITCNVDCKANGSIDEMDGNTFSSYVLDYDFSVLVREHNEGKAGFSTPDDFGDLHGKLYKCFVNSAAYRECFSKQPVICLSVASGRTYVRTENQHPVLGVEYRQD